MLCHFIGPITVSTPSLGPLFGSFDTAVRPSHCKPIVNKLLTNCQPIVNQLLTNCQPMVNQLSTNYQQIVNQYLINCKSIVT